MHHIPMTALFWFQKKSLKWSNYWIICVLTVQPWNPCLRFELVIESKLNWLNYTSAVTCQALGHKNATRSVTWYLQQADEGKHFFHWQIWLPSCVKENISTLHHKIQQYLTNQLTSYFDLIFIAFRYWKITQFH